MTIYTLRTTSGREDIVADMMLSKIRAEHLEVKAIVHPAELKGYIFIEGKLGDIHKAIHSMLHIRGLMERPVKMEEIQHFLDTTKARIAVDTADIVEIVGGPFKGERGKIQRIDKAKDEVTVELLEASVPIPVTIATEFVKLVKRAKGRKKEEEVKPAEEIQKEEVGLPGADEIRKGLAEKPEEKAKKETPAEEEPSVLEEAQKRAEASEEEKPSVLEEAQKKAEEFKAPETPEESEKITEPVIPREEEKEEEKPLEKKVIKPDEPVIMESEEELEKPVIPREEPGEEEKPEEDSLLAELEKKKKKKSPEDLEEGE